MSTTLLGRRHYGSRKSELATEVELLSHPVGALSAFCVARGEARSFYFP